LFFGINQQEYLSINHQPEKVLILNIVNGNLGNNPIKYFYGCMFFNKLTILILHNNLSQITFQINTKILNMRKMRIVLLIMLILPVMLTAQPLAKRQQYDISKEKVLYTIGYAHLDTEWNWDYPTTINQYIWNTMNDNFRLFEKYPDYLFNFTGSRRYNMMKEYYPESYKKVADYIKQGRW